MADAWQVYDAALLHMGLEGVTEWRIALFGDGSNAGNLSVAKYAALTNELPSANGYTRGGLPLVGATWTRAGRRVTFDTENVQWTARSGMLSPRFAVVYHGDAPLCVSALDVDVPDRGILNITMADEGLILLAGSDTR